jgi:hypothetical protein
MKRLICMAAIFGFLAMLILPAAAEDDSSKNILKEGLLGAVTGAVAADQSGGKAGKGALIGAGTNVIGGAVLDTVFGGGQTQGTSGTGYPSSQQTTSQKILKQGVMGAVTGGVAASASGGKAGKGALIGAGTNVIGGAVLDTVMGSGQQSAPAQQPVYSQPQQTPVYAPAATTSNDAQAWYQKGYQDGFKAGYQEGLNAQRPIVVPSRE